MAGLLSRSCGEMDASVSFPLFVFEKAGYSMFVVETPDKILYHMKPIDIENGDYLCWDTNGRAVRISIWSTGDRNLLR
jgi:hypothetical protein